MIRVECTNGNQVENAVVQALRLVDINDLEKHGDEMSLLIKARYQELPDYKAMQIHDDLQGLSGVLDIQIVKDGIPVKNIR